MHLDCVTRVEATEAREEDTDFALKGRDIAERGGGIVPTTQCGNSAASFAMPVRSEGVGRHESNVEGVCWNKRMKGIPPVRTRTLSIFFCLNMMSAA
jgi:hypothetical protein